MPFATATILAGIAAGAAVAGAGTSIYGASKQASAQGAAAQSQAVTAGWQSVATGVQAQSVQVQQEQQQLQIATQRSAIMLQQQSDDVRRQAATLDATRRQREIVRQGIMASSTALTRATAQGASASGSSALEGARGEISGRTGVNSQGVSQQLELGNRLFDINKTISATYLNAQDQNAGLVAQGGDLQQQILDIQKHIYDSGGQTALSYKDAAAAGGIAAFGSGLSSLGSAVVKNQENISNLSTYFSSAFGSGSNHFSAYTPTDI